LICSTDRPLDEIVIAVLSDRYKVDVDSASFPGGSLKSDLIHGIRALNSDLKFDVRSLKSDIKFLSSVKSSKYRLEEVNSKVEKF